MLDVSQLIIYYILSDLKFVFLEESLQRSKNFILLMPNNYLILVALHIRLSTHFDLTRLVDIFAYESPVPELSQFNKVGLRSKNLENLQVTVGCVNPSIVVYNFHSLLNYNRFFVFITGGSYKSSLVYSISDLFFAANWLEREVSELHGVNFFWKKDTRNLMLQYGDSTLPFQKSTPSIGFNELVFDPIKDTIVNNPVTVQL